MSLLAILAFPLILLEYFYTKERVTEEIGTAEETHPLREQLHVILHEKYWVLIALYFLIYTLGSSFKNSALVYYCNYVLGTYNDGTTQMLVSVIGGIPMGIGIFAVWPLARKFGKRNVTMAGFILYAIGGVICYLFPRNMVIVLIGQSRTSADCRARMFLPPCLPMFWIISNINADSAATVWQPLSTLSLLR